jgi:hypothetical protein
MGFCKSKLARLILPRRIFDFFDTIGRKKTFSAVRHPLSAGPKGIRIPGFSTAGALCALDLLDAPRLAGLSWRRARPLDQFQPRRPLATPLRPIEASDVDMTEQDLSADRQKAVAS